MTYTTLISTTDLHEHLDDPDWAILDCRFVLTDPEQGRKDYLLAHIPGAVYAHLDEDLCGPIIPGKTGRHPLPSIDEFVEQLSEWGIDSKVQVITYDDVGGALAAARLWWMLRWLGHGSVAVLDGGWTMWQKQALPVKGGREARSPRQFIPEPHPELLAHTEEIEEMRKRQDALVLDSRTADRYRGENETIDPVAGHIPGAISAPYPDNFDVDGKLLSKDALRARFEELLGDVAAEETAFYCGSGVTAVLNILAVAHAGFGEAKLYAGSWSKWITDPNRPVAMGE